jgi:hypothetical protein
MPFTPGDPRIRPGPGRPPLPESERRERERARRERVNAAQRERYQRNKVLSDPSRIPQAVQVLDESMLEVETLEREAALQPDMLMRIGRLAERIGIDVLLQVARDEGAETKHRVAAASRLMQGWTAAPKNIQLAVADLTPSVPAPAAALLRQFLIEQQGTDTSGLEVCVQGEKGSDA